jgi:hypothetical protein
MDFASLLLKFFNFMRLLRTTFYFNFFLICLIVGFNSHQFFADLFEELFTNCWGRFGGYGGLDCVLPFYSRLL